MFRSLVYWLTNAHYSLRHIFSNILLTRHVQTLEPWHIRLAFGMLAEVVRLLQHGHSVTHIMRMFVIGKRACTSIRSNFGKDFAAGTISFYWLSSIRYFGEVILLPLNGQSLSGLWQASSDPSTAPVLTIRSTAMAGLYMFIRAFIVITIFIFAMDAESADQQYNFWGAGPFPELCSITISLGFLCTYLVSGPSFE